jgi:hypothetical protein
MTKLKFEYPAGAPTTTLEFEYALEMSPPMWNAISASPYDQAHDGTSYSYDKGTAQEFIPLTIDLLTEADRDNLIDFVNNIVEGGFRVFRFTNHDGEWRDVKFFNEKWNFGDGTVPYSVSVELLRV